MPKAKTMLDELVKVLKVRDNAIERAYRRSDAQHGALTDLDIRRIDEAEKLIENLDNSAIRKYDRLVRINEDEDKIFKTLPYSIRRKIRGEDYIYK